MYTLYVYIVLEPKNNVYVQCTFNPSIIYSIIKFFLVKVKMENSAVAMELNITR